MADTRRLLNNYAADQLRRGLMPSTIDRRRSYLWTFARWLGDTPITAATSGDVEAFLARKPLQARTRYSWLSHLSSFYRWAIRHGHADHDPTATIERPRLRRLLPRPIDEDSLALALSRADRRMHAWLMLAAYAGLRCAEIAGLDRDGVLVPERLLRVTGKGYKDRIVPLRDDVLASLNRYGLPRSGPVFLHPVSRKPFRPAEVSREGALFLDSLGVDATMHKLRHRFGTRAYEECQDIRVVQELLGHASPVTTAGYTAYSQQRAARAVHAL